MRKVLEKQFKMKTDEISSEQRFAIVKYSELFINI